MGIWPNAEWTLFGAFRFVTQKGKKDKKATKEAKRKDAKSRKRKA